MMKMKKFLPVMALLMILLSVPAQAAPWNMYTWTFPAQNTVSGNTAQSGGNTARSNNTAQSSGNTARSNNTAQSGKTCIVVKGDTLWKIASRFRTGTRELLEANPQIENADLIYPGQTLSIPQQDSAVTNYESEVVRLVNEVRAQYGLNALTEDWELSRVARYKSQDMRDKGYFDHTSPTYGTPFQMMKSFGLSYRTAGENIAYGYSTPQTVMNGWMNSSGHRANILNASYTRIGVGYVADGNYWTQMFIG